MIRFLTFLGSPLPMNQSQINSYSSNNHPSIENQYFEQNHPGISSPTNSNIPDSSSIPHTSQFVQSTVGIGQRSLQKRSTFKRTNRVETSNDDLLHDSYLQQQQIDINRLQSQYEHNHPFSNLTAPPNIRHVSTLRPNVSAFGTGTNSNSSTIRPPLIHGAHDSRNSSGQDSGMSSGGTSFDPEQHHMRMITNQNQTSTSAPSNAPQSNIYEVPPKIPIPRRKSLPSIVKKVPGDYKVDETARSNDHLAKKETYIIENGIRKRVTEQAPTYTDSGTLLPQTTVMTSSTGSPTLARRIILESLERVDALSSTTNRTGGNKRISMPTLANVARQRHAAPSKFN